MNPPIEVIERFWSKVDKESSEKGCWIWKAGTTDDGYGAYSWLANGSRGWQRAHRFAYLTTIGKPDKPELHHICDERLCVNPEHLQPMTRKEHMRATPGTYGYKWAHRTHCENGHLLEGDNLVPFALKQGYRKCRACANEASRQWRANNPEKMKESTAKWRAKNHDRKLEHDRWRYHNVVKPRKQREQGLSKSEQS